MQARAIFPTAPLAAGLYESYFLRAVSPDEPVGVWIRYTVHKRPGRPPQGSLWCTVFDARMGRPFMHKLTSQALVAPTGGWLEVEGARIGPEGAHGSCGPASWSLSFSGAEADLEHLPWSWLYRMPLPRTKPTSPLPALRLAGTVELEGRTIELDGWRGMVGHNWGSEHAERWIWLAGVGFEAAPEAWLDVTLARVRVAGVMTPWIANGVLSLDGRRHRLGGLGARGLSVAESSGGAVMRLPGEQGMAVGVRVQVPAQAAAGWRYADPCEGEPREHDVVNCSVAALTLSVALQDAATVRILHTAHGGAYELGMRERDHGVLIAPFGDGEQAGVAARGPL